MRMARRLGLVGKKASKYTWEIYNIAYGLGEQPDNIGSGSFSVTTGNRYWTVSTTFTATESTFTLANPISVNRSSMKVGHYMVSNSSSGSSAKTGSYLYEITGVTWNGTTAWISYRRWSPSQIKGATLQGTVSSNTMDYPEDGVQGNYWYVLVQSGSSGGTSTPVYYWDRYNVSAMAKDLGTSTTSMSVLDSLNSYRYVVSPIDAEIVYANGVYKWKLNNPTYTRADLLEDYSVGVVDTMATGNYTNTEGLYLYQYFVDDSNTLYTQVIVYTVTQYGIQLSKGEYIDTVSSSSKEYPNDGEQDGYWYELIRN